MDLQAISDANNAHKYIMGYNFKMEDDATTHRRVEELIARLSREGDIDAHDVYRIAHAALQGRSTSTFEACHLLLGEPVVQFSRDNVWIQTSRPEEWTVAVPRHEEVAALENPSDYAQMHHRMPALLQHYSDLQKDNPAGGSEIDLPVEGGSRRIRVAWVTSPSLTSWLASASPTEMALLKLCLGTSQPLWAIATTAPTRSPRTSTMPSCCCTPSGPDLVIGFGTWMRDPMLEPFHRLLSEDAIYLGSQCYPNYNGSLTTARELFKVQAEMYLRGQMEGNEAEEHYRGTLSIMEQLRLRCGTQIDMDVPDYVDTTSWNIGFGEVPGGQHAFDTLTAEENQFDELIARQRKVMELIVLATLTNGSNPKSPKLRLLLHGPGGSGKSFILRAAAQCIRSAQKGVVIAAYTGAAAYQAGGVTLHSCLGLPVVNKSYGQHEADVPLPQGARLQHLKDIWRHIDLLIIDEMSLVSAKLLKRIDLRLRHIKALGANLPFGGVNIVLIGDFYQLPPVLDQPIFHDLNLFKLFQLCELAGNHRAAGDPTWAALLGRVRKGLQTEADIALLRSRLKKSIDTKAVRLHATRAGVAKTNQQMLDYHLANTEKQEIYECPAQDLYESKLGMEFSAASNAYANAEDLAASRTRQPSPHLDANPTPPPFADRDNL